MVTRLSSGILSDGFRNSFKLGLTREKTEGSLEVEMFKIISEHFGPPTAEKGEMASWILSY